MADSSALFIVLLILILCIASFIVSMWTCTGGSWDFDNWEWGSCVKIPGSDPSPAPAPTQAPSDTIPDSGGSGSGSQPDLYTSRVLNLYVEKSEHFMECPASFEMNSSVSCFNKDNNGAAISWYSAQNAISNTCKSHIKHIIVYINSTSQSSLYYYTELGPTDTSFYFKNAPEGFVTTQLGGSHAITFVVHFLDKDKKLLAPEISQVLIPESQVGDCSNLGVGDGVDWNTENIKEWIPPTPTVTIPDPVNCSGGTWTPIGGCMLDGEEVDPNGCGQMCFQKYYYGGINFIPAKDGGECVRIKEIGKSRPSCNQATVQVPKDCVLSNWRIDINADGSTCTAECGGGIRREYRDVIQDPQEGGKECEGALTREVDCNTQDCPVNCVGKWECGDEYTEEVMNPGVNQGGKKYRSKDCTYAVSQPANPYGSPCPHATGEKNKESRTVCWKSAGLRKFWKDAPIGGDNCPW
jgi:hypothetical protein